MIKKLKKWWNSPVNPIGFWIVYWIFCFVIAGCWDEWTLYWFAFDDVNLPVFILLLTPWWLTVIFFPLRRWWKDFF